MKVGVVGTGSVGSCAAYAMIMSGVASELVLIDPDEALARAQAEDLADATPFAGPVRIAAAGYAQLEGARAVALCCGVRQRPGESRTELLTRNAVIFGMVVPQIMERAPGALLLVVSNPVDALTDLVWKASGKAAGRVLGTGTVLDTARFRCSLGRHLGIAPGSVHGYVLGEHGDSEVLAWSSVAVGGVPLEAFADQVGRPLTPEARTRIDGEVRHAAARIIDGKGSTSYGIGGAITQILRAVRDDERTLLTVSAPQGESCYSLPRIVGAAGIERTLIPSLSMDERKALDASAALIAEAIASIGQPKDP